MLFQILVGFSWFQCCASTFSSLPLLPLHGGNLGVQEAEGDEKHFFVVLSDEAVERMLMTQELAPAPSPDRDSFGEDTGEDMPWAVSAVRTRGDTGEGFFQVEEILGSVLLNPWTGHILNALEVNELAQATQAVDIEPTTFSMQDEERGESQEQGDETAASSPTSESYKRASSPYSPSRKSPSSPLPSAPRLGEGGVPDEEAHLPAKDDLEKTVHAKRSRFAVLRGESDSDAEHEEVRKGGTGGEEGKAAEGQGESEPGLPAGIPSEPSLEGEQGGENGGESSKVTRRLPADDDAPEKEQLGESNEKKKKKKKKQKKRKGKGEDSDAAVVYASIPEEDAKKSYEDQSASHPTISALRNEKIMKGVVAIADAANTDEIAMRFKELLDVVSGEMARGEIEGESEADARVFIDNVLMTALTDPLFSCYVDVAMKKLGVESNVSSGIGKSSIGSTSSRDPAASSDAPSSTALPASAFGAPLTGKKGKKVASELPLSLSVLKDQVLKTGLDVSLISRDVSEMDRVGGKHIINPSSILGVSLPRLINLALASFQDEGELGKINVHISESFHKDTPVTAVPKDHPSAYQLVDPVAAAFTMLVCVDGTVTKTLPFLDKEDELIITFQISAGEQKGARSREPRGTRAEGFLSNRSILYSEWDPRVMKMLVQGHIGGGKLEGAGFWVSSRTPHEKLEILLRNVDGPAVLASQESMLEEYGAEKCEKGGKGWANGKLKDGFGSFVLLGVFRSPASSPKEYASLVLSYLSAMEGKAPGEQHSVWIFVRMSKLENLKVGTWRGKVMRAKKEGMKVGTFLTTWN